MSPELRDSREGIINSIFAGAAIGAVVGGIVGGLAGAGLPGGLGLAGDLGWGFDLGFGAGEAAALSSKLGALAGGVASIFTGPGDADGSESGPCR